MAKIIRYCMSKESHVGPNCFIVCRPSVLGNPFTHIKDRKTKAIYVVNDREEAIKCYEEYYDKMVVLSAKFKEEVDKMYQACLDYDEVYVGCFCPLTETCHSDYIIKKLRERLRKYMLERLKCEKIKPKTDEKCVEKQE